MKLKSTLAHSLRLLSAAILYVGLLAPSTQAQFLWSERIASIASWPEGEPNIGLALDSSDNCYVTGFFDDTNDFVGVTLTNQSAGGSDIFLAKYNSSGVLQWVQRAGGTSINCGRGTGVDANGNVYITGGYQGPANFGNTNLSATSGEEFFLAKYNNAGIVQWIQPSTGGSSDVYGIGLVVDGAGNSYALVVVDRLDDQATNITFGSTTVPIPANGGSPITILVKFDNTGAVKWTQLFGGSDEVYATKVAVDAAGNAYVRGTFFSTLTIGASNLMVSAGSTKNMFVAKLNNSGALTWVQQPTGGNSGEGGVAVDTAGNVYVSGGYTTNLNFGNGIILTNQASTNAPFGDAFLAKYNSSGAIQWALSAGSTKGGFYWGLALDGQSNIYAAGFLNSQTAVAKYNPAGTLQWTYSASGAPANPIGSTAINCAVDSTGNCYLDGLYQGTVNFGANTLQPQEAWNFFLAVTASSAANQLFFDNFEQFANGTDLTSTNYTPASGPVSASVITSVQNGSPTIIATNFLVSTWAFFDNSVVTSKNSYKGVLAAVQTNQLLQVTWRMWIQATNTGPGMFLFSIPTSDPAANYNPPISFTDAGSIVALTNGTSVQTPIGNWSSLAGSIMTNTLILNYPAHTFSYSLNGQTLATLPLGPYFTNVVDAIYFTGFERSAGSLGNRFAIDDVTIALAAPQMALVRSGANVILTWPTNATGFTAQSTTNLSPAVWSAVSPAPVVVNGQNTLTNPISGTQMFYRLSK